MASLKEVKGRINSINGTLKITSAMKMVASSKLHKAQEAIENMLPYERRLHRMLTNFLSAEQSVESPFIVKREVKKIAIVVFASNSTRSLMNMARKWERRTCWSIRSAVKWPMR